MKDISTPKFNYKTVYHADTTSAENVFPYYVHAIKNGTTDDIKRMLYSTQEVKLSEIRINR